MKTTISARLSHTKIGIALDLDEHVLENADEVTASHFDNFFETKKDNA